MTERLKWSRLRVSGDGPWHERGDTRCEAGWCSSGSAAGYPKLCRQPGCGGLVHADFGDENSDCEFWLYTRCDRCGVAE